jgi:hypothetical protein
MSAVKTLKLTPAEVELLTWLVSREYADSDSQVIRRAVLEFARVNGAPIELVRRVQLQREHYRPRRSAKVCKLLGQRRKGEALAGGNT